MAISLFLFAQIRYIYCIRRVKTIDFMLKSQNFISTGILWQLKLSDLLTFITFSKISLWLVFTYVPLVSINH